MKRCPVFPTSGLPGVTCCLCIKTRWLSSGCCRGDGGAPEYGDPGVQGSVAARQSRFQSFGGRAPSRRWRVRGYPDYPKLCGKTHSGLTAGSNKPYQGDEFLVKSASSKKRRALTLYEHPASHNPTVKVNVNSQRAERQLRIPSHSLTIPHPLFGENNIQRDARNAPGCRLP